MQHQLTMHFPTEVNLKEAKRLTVVPRKSANAAFADMVDCESSEPFDKRLMEEYIHQFGHMAPKVMEMIEAHSRAYKKVKGRCKGAKAFLPYAAYVRDELYRGDNKFLQMGRKEPKLMFIGAMLSIMDPKDPERTLFIRLWNKNEQTKFSVKEPELV